MMMAGHVVIVACALLVPLPRPALRHAPPRLLATPSISPTLFDALQANGIAALNPLQEVAVDAGTRGLDMIVHAQTGSGKTLCFALPLLEQVKADPTPLQALVLAPTIELAAQTARVLNALQPGSAAALPRDATKLPDAPVLVGPPGMVMRLLAGVAKGDGGGAGRAPQLPSIAQLASLRVVVLDEADAMVMPLSRYATQKQKQRRETKPKEAAVLLEALCKERGASLQVLAASATVGRPLRRLLASLCDRQLEVIRAPEADGTAAGARANAMSPPPPSSAVRAVSLPSGLRVAVVTCDADNVISALHGILEGEAARQPLLFIKEGRSLAREIQLFNQCALDAAALDAAVLGQRAIAAPPAGARAASAAAKEAAGDEEPSAGNENGRRLLVASPSGARGLDLHGLDVVIIAGVPPSADSFLHLAGRTGRQGQPGRVVVLTTPEEADQRLPTIGSQLGVDFRADRRHHTDRDEKWSEMWRVHEKMVRADERGTSF